MKMSGKYAVLTGPGQGFGIHKWVVGMFVVAALYAIAKNAQTQQ